MSFPQVPQTVAHAEHVAPSDRPRDTYRSIERARAEAAEALERGARDREFERLRKEHLEREREHQRKQQSSLLDDQSDGVHGDVEKAAEPSSLMNHPNNSFSSRSKAALSSLSKAMFRFTGHPSSPTSPFPREGRYSTISRPQSPASRRSFFPRLPSRLTHLAPWPALNVPRREDAESEHEGTTTNRSHHHYYHHAPTGSVSYPNPHGDLENGSHHHDKSVYSANGRLLRCSDCHKQRKRQKCMNLWCIILFILILLLLGNTIFLNIRVLRASDPTVTEGVVQNPVASAITTAVVTNVRGSATTIVVSTTAPAKTTVVTTGAPAATSTPAVTVSPELTECLSQFKLNAPSNPRSYPCAQCIPHLQSVPNDLVDGTSPPVTGQGNALQFCAAKAIADSVPSSGNGNTLTNVGWLKDVSPCGWAGITCDNNGRAVDLELVAPGIPTTLPQELSLFVHLQKISIAGDAQAPSGDFSIIASIPSLTQIILSSTSISGDFDSISLPNSLPNLQVINWNKNPNLKMGSKFGDVAGLNGLTGLVVNFQGVSNEAFNALLASTSLPNSLTTLDLSSNSLSGQVPIQDLSTFTKLQEMNLDNNQFTSIEAGAFPGGGNLNGVSFGGNTGLTGTLGPDACASLSKTTRCGLSGTALTINSNSAGRCGACSSGGA
ncbi:hypothetical protein FRC03_009260 [Tulasnella sp. 419]|nr:hypothetical protein FRC03_009260 [Tulasnella sp. 419]